MPAGWTLIEVHNMYRFQDMIANVLDSQVSMTYVGTYNIADAYTYKLKNTVHIMVEFRNGYTFLKCLNEITSKNIRLMFISLEKGVSVSCHLLTIIHTWQCIFITERHTGMILAPICSQKKADFFC